jgi:hypothetical protein
VISDATANGTMTYHPVSSIAIQAARIVSTSLLVTARTPSTRYATTAPIHPIENVRCALKANLRTGGRITMVVGPIDCAERAACGRLGHHRRVDDDPGHARRH